MKRKTRTTIRTFVLEVVVYALLVGAYYLVVLHVLGDRLNNLFHENRKLYAGLALGLIVGQGLLLENITRLLLMWIPPQGED